MDKDMIEKARKIINRRLFTTTKDYNALPGGYEYLEQAAFGNRQKLTSIQRQQAIDRLNRKLGIADSKVICRMRLGRSRGGTAGALNRDVHKLGFASDEIRIQIKMLQENK